MLLRLGRHRDGNLADKLDGKPLLAREPAKLVEAMQLAHSRNVVHRDLKPADVLGSEPSPAWMQAPSLAALRRVHTAASSKTYSNRSATMVLDRRPLAARVPCDATAATESVGDGRREP